MLDIKPYLPYAEALPKAVGGFAKEAPEPMVVRFCEDVEAELNEELRALITQVLAVDPRPAFHDDGERVYGCRLAGMNVRWRVQDGQVMVLSQESLSSRGDMS